MQKTLVGAALAAMAFTPLAANAQAAGASAAKGPAAQAAAPAATAAPKAGAKVFDPQGAEVGTIESVDAANAVVFTGTKRATLPLSAFGKSEKGLLISMSQAQLNAAVAAAEAKTTSTMAAALVPDAQIKSRDGTVVGTVQKVEGDNVTIALTGGSPVTVTKQYLTVGADGGLALTMNAADFKSAVAAATQASSTQAAGADTKTNGTGGAATSSN